ERLQALPEAEADFQKALGLSPHEDARYVLLLTRGVFHFNQRNLGQAEADFRAARALKPDQYNAYLNLAQVYLARGQFDLAAGEEERALRRRPPAQVVWSYHVERGRNLLKGGRYEEALRACAAATALLPQRPLPYAVRARALLELGRYEEAEAVF